MGQHEVAQFGAPHGHRERRERGAVMVACDYSQTSELQVPDRNLLAEALEAVCRARQSIERCRPQVTDPLAVILAGRAIGHLTEVLDDLRYLNETSGTAGLRVGVWSPTRNSI